MRKLKHVKLFENFEEDGEEGAEISYICCYI